MANVYSHQILLSLSFLLRFISFVFIFMLFLGTQGYQKRVSDPLEPELRWVWLLGTECGSFARAVLYQCFNRMYDCVPVSVSPAGL